MSKGNIYIVYITDFGKDPVIVGAFLTNEDATKCMDTCLTLDEHTGAGKTSYNIQAVPLGETLYLKGILLV
jgi:hypothetical protein